VADRGAEQDDGAGRQPPQDVWPLVWGELAAVAVQERLAEHQRVSVLPACPLGAEGDLMELDGWTPRRCCAASAPARGAPGARRTYDRIMAGSP
jgi:hypothetical protein